MNASLPLLRNVALFHTISDGVLDEIEALSQPRAVEEGSFFFMQGDPAHYLYVLSLGRVKLTQVTLDGQQVVMRMLGSGQMFGGGAMLHPENGYPVTAEAMEDSTALAWEAYGFEKLAEKNPVLSVNMMRLMQAYVQEMQSRYLEISTERVEQRLARSLVRLTSQMGIKIGGGD